MTSGRYGHSRIALLTVIQEETAAVRTVLGFTDRLRGKPYLVQAGADQTHPDVINREIGRANIRSGECIGEVLEHWRPEVAILCGVAGGIDQNEPTISVGDVVVPEYVHYSSFAKLSERGEQRRYLPYDHPSIALHANFAAPLRDDTSWITPDLLSLPPDGRPPRVFTNSLVAGDKVMGRPSSEEQQQVVAGFDEAIAIDMESVGLCRAIASARRSVNYNPRLLIIRGISDLLSSTANSEERALNKELAARVAATFARRVVDDILQFEPDARFSRSSS